MDLPEEILLKYEDFIEFNNRFIDCEIERFKQSEMIDEFNFFPDNKRLTLPRSQNEPHSNKDIFVTSLTPIINSNALTQGDMKIKERIQNQNKNKIIHEMKERIEFLKPPIAKEFHDCFYDLPENSRWEGDDMIITEENLDTMRLNWHYIIVDFLKNGDKFRNYNR